MAFVPILLHSVPHNSELAYIKLSLISKATFHTKNHSINSMLKSSVISNGNNEIPAYFELKMTKIRLTAFQPIKI